MKYLLRHLLALGLLMAASVVSRAQYTLAPLWTGPVSNANFFYLANNNTHRGMAYNRETGHLLVVSRAPTNGIHIIDPANGAYLGSLKYNASLMTGGALVINLVGVADDGAIYVGNVTAPGSVAAASQLRIYRWAGESDLEGPTLAFNGDASDGALDNNNRRFGDSMLVRGSGENTEIIVASRTGSLISLLRTADGLNFVATPLNSAVPLGTGTLGLTTGPGGSIFAKAPSTALRNLKIDTLTGTAPALAAATTQSQFTPPYGAALPASTAAIGYDVQNKLLALVNYTAHTVSLYDVADPANPILQDTKTFSPPVTANPNGTGAADFGGGRLFAMDSNNGLLAFTVVPPPSPVPPIVGVTPQTVTALEGYFTTLTAFAAGSSPLSFQWTFNGVPLPGATNVTLSMNNLATSQSGTYGIIVSNVAGMTNAPIANLTVQPVACSDALTLLWRQAPGTRPYLTTDNNQRGLAYNTPSNHVLVVSRAGTTNIPVLDGDNGSLLWNLPVSGISGGTFGLNLIGVADDGVVYACNLTQNGITNAFKLYRWANDGPTTTPTVIYSGDPGAGVAGRWGDSFDVRGAADDTEIVISSRDGTNVVFFTTSDGVNFQPTPVIINGIPGGALGVGLAFGQGSTLWAKPNGFDLRQIEYDLDAQTGEVVRQFGSSQFPAGVCVIGVDVANNRLAGVALENPDNLRLYDLKSGAQVPQLLDQEFFPTDNANINATGAVDFGNGRVYALDSNNGILAMTVQTPTPPVLVWGIEAGNLVLEYPSCSRLQSAPSVTGPWTDVSGAGNPYATPLTGGPLLFFRLR